MLTRGQESKSLRPNDGSIKTNRNLELSGAQWTTRYAGSTSHSALQPLFRIRAGRFLGALRQAGAKVIISSTYRAPERAYLMHWAWLIVKRDLDPRTIPAMEGVPIGWAHEGADGLYSRMASVSAARAMVTGFGIANLGVAPALKSRHTAGYGIDMNISWHGVLSILDAAGKAVRIETMPRSGLNRTLHSVGASYGVIKYNRSGRGDPHWSDNGS